MVTHGDRDRKKPFIWIRDERCVAWRVLCGYRWELVKRRRDWCRRWRAYRPKSTLNNFRARDRRSAWCTRLRRVLRFAALFNGSANFIFRFKWMLSITIKQKTRWNIILIDRLTSANPNRIFAEPVLEQIAYGAEKAMITFQWRFARPEETWRLKILMMIRVFYDFRLTLWHPPVMNLNAPF